MMKLLQIENYSKEVEKYCSLEFDQTRSNKEYELLYNNFAKPTYVREKNIAKGINSIYLVQRNKTRIFDLMIIKAFGNPFGIVMSEKAFGLFSKNRITDHNIIDVQFSNRPNLTGYKWLLFIDEDTHINFKKTFKKNPFNVKVNNENDYIEFKKNKNIIVNKTKFEDLRLWKQMDIEFEQYANLERISLVNNIFKKYNLLKLKYDHHVYIDCKFAKELQENNISGANFLDFDLNSKYEF